LGAALLRAPHPLDRERALANAAASDGTRVSVERVNGATATTVAEVIRLDRLERLQRLRRRQRSRAIAPWRRVRLSVDGLAVPAVRLDALVVQARELVALPATVDLGSAMLRVAPHSIILVLAIMVIVVGGFRRPDPGFTAAMGLEQGHLSLQARLALGPRAAEVVPRDSLVRPVRTGDDAPGQPRADVITYTVQPGDTVWDIGARFNVGAYSVLWSNGLDEDDIIRPGQQLLVPPVPGAVRVVTDDDTLDSIARRYNVDPSVIVDFNGLRPGEVLQPGRQLIIPGGELPIAPKPVPTPPPARPAPAPVRPAPAAPAAPARPQTQAPPAQQLPAPPPPSSPPVPTGRLSWPTRGVITTYFSGWHPGIDIANSLGTPIGAADGGTVIWAGWDSTGYGYRVVINHGNGYSTTYNHLSVISVRPGQSVGKGQMVGLMGSTGNSTGPHLHFEVLRNGTFVNPLGVLN